MISTGNLEGKLAIQTDQLKVGVHSLGYVAESTKQAADDFFPGYAHTMTEIGKERGWPKMTRDQF